ncbi:MAG: Chromate resistance protein ChrB, partial [Candidatus Rokuibacteriota bacterium]
MLQGWVVLMVSVPPHPSSLRVRFWRRFRALGAVALKKSVYILPFTPENFEQFQWLAQEVQRSGGEATLLRVERIENMQPADVVRLFRDARDQEYRALAARYRKVAGGLDRKPTGPAAARRDEELARLGRELARAREIDFFDAPGYHEVLRLRERIEARLRPPAIPAPGRPDTVLQG